MTFAVQRLQRTGCAIIFTALLRVSLEFCLSVCVRRSPCLIYKRATFASLHDKSFLKLGAGEFRGTDFYSPLTREIKRWWWKIYSQFIPWDLHSELKVKVNPVKSRLYLKCFALQKKNAFYSTKSKHFTYSLSNERKLNLKSS